jgi:hypothetical protein
VIYKIFDYPLSRLISLFCRFQIYSRCLLHHYLFQHLTLIGLIDTQGFWLPISSFMMLRRIDYGFESEENIQRNQARVNVCISVEPYGYTHFYGNTFWRMYQISKMIKQLPPCLSNFVPILCGKKLSSAKFGTTNSSLAYQSKVTVSKRHLKLFWHANMLLQARTVW